MFFFSFELYVQDWAIKILHTINVKYKYNHFSLLRIDISVDDEEDVDMYDTII